MRTRQTRSSRASSPTTMPDYVYERTKSPVRRTSTTSRTKSPARAASPAARVARSPARKREVTIEEQIQHANDFVHSQLATPAPKKRAGGRRATPKPTAVTETEEEEEDSVETPVAAPQGQQSSPTRSPARTTSPASTRPTSPLRSTPGESSSSVTAEVTPIAGPSNVSSAPSSTSSSHHEDSEDNDDGLTSVYVVAMFVAVAAVLVSLPYAVYATPH